MSTIGQTAGALDSSGQPDHNMTMKIISILLALPLAACATATAPNAAPADHFMTGLQSLCGKAFEGKVVTKDPADASFAGQRLVMHVRQCSETEVRIPFHVGSDRSRTWVVTRTASGLRLKHDHRHEDGKPDTLTMYGGDSGTPGTAARQEFPVDQESIDLFTREAGRFRTATSGRWRSEKASSPMSCAGHLFPADASSGSSST